MQLAVQPEGALVQPDGQRNAQRIAVLECHGALDAHHVGGQADMIIIRMHQAARQLQRLHIAAAEGHLRLIVRHQLIAGTGAAHGAQGQVLAKRIQLLLPQVRIGQQPAVRHIHQTLGNGQQRRALGNAGQHIIAEPFHAEAAYAADHQVRALEGLLQLLNLIKLHALGKITVEFQVAVGLAGVFDDFAVQMRAHQAHLAAVFARRKGQRRAHHARAYDRDNSHLKQILL